MAGRVAGKLALVTGAAQGLGAQAAKTLAREGARVVDEAAVVLAHRRVRRLGCDVAAAAVDRPAAADRRRR